MITGESRGQSQIDFMIGVFIISVFVGATLFISGSPLVAGSGEDVDLQSEAERLLIQFEKNALTDESGAIDQTKIENTVIATDDVDQYTTTKKDINRSVVLSTTNSSNKPTVFDGRGEEIVIGSEPRNIGVYTSSTTIYLDGVPVRVKMVVWWDP
jgi:hypothetical protein